MDLVDRVVDGRPRVEDRVEDVPFEGRGELLERWLHELERPVQCHRDREWRALACRDELFRGVDVLCCEFLEERHGDFELVAIDDSLVIARGELEGRIGV